MLWIHRSKVSLLLFKLLLDLDSILVCRVERGDVQEFYVGIMVQVWSYGTGVVLDGNSIW